MARRQRGFSPGRQALRRKTSWGLGPGGTGATQVTSSGALIVGAGASATDDGLTLVRTRGSFDMQIADTAGISDAIIGAMGIGIVTAEAFAIGITAVPSPITDDVWDGWLFHQYFGYSPGLIISTTLVSAGYRIPVDSKAMRKLDFGDTIFFGLETVETGTVVLNVMANSRLLVKLP